MKPSRRSILAAAGALSLARLLPSSSPAGPAAPVVHVWKGRACGATSVPDWPASYGARARRQFFDLVARGEGLEYSAGPVRVELVP